MDALELARLIGSPDFQGKLREFIAKKEAADKAIEQAEKTKAEAADLMAAVNQAHADSQAKLQAGKIDHDKAANEAAARIKLASDLEAKNAEKEKLLADREARLEDREKAVNEAHGSFTSALRQLGLAS